MSHPGPFVANGLAGLARPGRVPGMKMSLGFLGLAVGLAAAEPARLRDLPPDQFRAAGLHKLSAEELAVLEAHWARRAAAVRGEADEQLAQVREEAAARIASAESRARRAEENADGGDGKSPGWLKALVTLKRTEERPEDARALESRMAGDFKGWTGRTLFHLENGQVWQQVAGGEYFDKTLRQPAVRIYPAALGAYWLEIEGVKQRVRVRPQKLE